MIDSPFAIAIIWPLAFAILQTILNSLATDGHREGDRKYRIWYTLNDKRFQKSPLTFDQIKKELNNENIVADVEVLPLSLWETSLGIDLCIAAMSTDLVNVLILLDNQYGNPTLSLIQIALITLTIEFIAATSIAYFFRNWNENIKSWKRIFIVQATNFAGLVAMFISFLIFGNVIIK